MKNNNRDIYEIFNDMKFDNEFEAIEMDEIEVTRLKKVVREKMQDQSKNEISKSKTKKKERWSKKSWLKIASIVAIIILSMGFTPKGKEVLAQIANKLFFNPSLGVISEEQWGNTYVLEEPIRVNINGDSTLIKNIVNNGDYISIEMWTNEETDYSNPNFKEEYENLSDNKVQQIKENYKLKTMEGEYLSVDGYSMASGGYTVISFNQGRDLIKEFDLYYGESEIGHFKLKQIKYVESYDELGGNTTNNGILIGATSYYLEGERYFRLWSNMDNFDTNEYRVDIEEYNSIKVTDNTGKPLKFESANDGTGKTYKLLEDYNEELYISISDIDLRYNLREGTSMSLSIPSKGETYIINKELNLKGLRDKAVIKTITHNNGKYENGDYIITLDYSNNYDNSRFIYMASERFRSGGAMGDPENKSSEIYLDRENLNLTERLFKRINIKIDNILVKQYGDWKFQVK